MLRDVKHYLKAATFCMDGDDLLPCCDACCSISAYNSFREYANA